MGDYGRLVRSFAAAVMGLALAGAALAQDGIRMIDGSLTYRERMALPDDALAVIEARDVRGRLLGEATLRTRGAQVPIPFQIAVPAGLDARLRAAIFVDGQPRWFVPDEAIPSGVDPVSVGELVLARFIPMGFASTYRCGSSELAVGFFEANAVLDVGGRRRVLEPAPAASGARFEVPGDPGTWVWSREDGVTISLDGETLPTCSVVPPKAPRPYRGQGNEPGWTLSIAEGRVILTLDYGARTVEAPLPEAAFENGAFVYRLPAEGIDLRLSPGICRDDMTGMPYPESVSVTVDGRELRGCGGDPLDLLTGEDWTVEDIDGRGIVDSALVTLSFGEDGGLSGAASCNRYATRFQITGEGASVAQIAATQMMCPEALMTQEQAFFAALSGVRGFDIDETGALLLYDSGRTGAVLTARR
jgi:heat shock protein HslJ